MSEQIVRADATRCKVCGGPFAAKRVVIDGDQYHERCALMSYPPHTHEDYARLAEQHAALLKALEDIDKRLDDFGYLPTTKVRKLARAAINAAGSSPTAIT